MNMHAYKFLALFFLLAAPGIHQLHAASTKATADADPKTEKTFTFAVGKALFDSARNQVWTITQDSLASKTSATQDYALAYTPLLNLENPNDKQLVTKQMTPEKVTLITYTNNTYASTKDVANPLRQEEFDQLFLTNFNIGVSKTNSDHLYVVTGIQFSEPASKANTATVYKYTPADSYKIAKADSSGAIIYSFETEKDAAFGAGAARLNLIQSYSKKVNNESQTYLLNYTNGSTADATAATITTSSSFLTASTNALSSLNSTIITAPVDGGMYIGFSGQANATSGSVFSPLVIAAGTASIVKDKVPEGQKEPDEKDATYVNKSKLTVKNLLLDATAQAAQTSYITAGANATLGVTNITTLKTSTGLTYLLVATNTGVDTNVRLVAVPLVTMAEETTQNGLIADLTSFTKKYSNSGSRLVTAGFNTPLQAANVAQIQQETTALLVGGSARLPVQKNIAHLYTLGDRVYLVSNESYDANNQPGLFATQALFDKKGLIAGWTPWSRVAGTNSPMVYATHNSAFNTVVCLSTTTNAGDTISQTLWNDSSLLQRPFLDELKNWTSIGGVQGLFSFTPEQTGTPLSLLVATGHNKVVIAQTGLLNDNNQLVPTAITDQTLAVVDFSDLSIDLGGIVACDIVCDQAEGVSHYTLVVGGAKGIALLYGDGKCGWTSAATTFAELNLNAAWLQSSNPYFAFTKKIICQNNMLFILARGHLSGLSFFIPEGEQTIFDGSISLLADRQNYEMYNHAFFTDFAVSPAYTVDVNEQPENSYKILLGTTQGLYQFASIAPAFVTKVSTNTDLQVVSSITLQSNDAQYRKNFGVEQTLADVYVLFTDFASDQSAVQRFTVTAGAGNLLTVEAVQDELAEGQITPLLVFNQFKHALYIDPAGWYISVFATSEHVMMYHFINGSLVSGHSNSSALLGRSLVSAALQRYKQSRYISATVKECATGALLVAGSFGVMINS